MYCGRINIETIRIELYNRGAQGDSGAKKHINHLKCIIFMRAIARYSRKAKHAVTKLVNVALLGKFRDTKFRGSFILKFLRITYFWLPYK